MATPTDQQLIDAAANSLNNAGGISSWSANGTSVSRESPKGQLDTLERLEARKARRLKRMVGKVVLTGW